MTLTPEQIASGRLQAINDLRDEVEALVEEKAGLTDELRQARCQVQAAKELAEEWTNDFEPAHSFGAMLSRVVADAAETIPTGAPTSECRECFRDASDGPVGSDGHGACADCAGSAD